jgi:hypothetical protein
MAETKSVAEETPPEEPAKQRRRFPVIPVLIFLAIIGGAAYLFVIRSKPEQAVRRLIDYQLKLSEAGVGEKLYDDTLSLQAKQQCPRDDFVGAIQQTPPDFWNLTRYKNLHIKVEGKRAIVTYVITYNGVVVDRATPSNPDFYSIATTTKYGDLITVAEQLQELAALNKPGVAFFASEKSYQDARKAVMKKGDFRRVLSKAGEWYDDYDAHSRCR